jgi:hypothetical protein
VEKWQRIRINLYTFMKKMFYTAPEIEVVEILVEAGFALSGIGSDYGDGGEGEEMD